MITINGRAGSVRELDATHIPDHTQHFFGDNGFTCKVVPVASETTGGHCYYVYVSSPTNRDFDSKPSLSRWHAAERVNQYLRALPIAEGDYLEIFINQGWRECTVTQIKRTRYRIEYEMPNAGLMGGWHPILFKDNGVAYIEGRGAK